MYQVSNFTENDDVKVLSELGAFQIIEYQRDLSVSPSSAVTAYFSAQMNVKKRQLVCHLHKSHVTIQAGAMQWMLGNVNATTGIKGVGDFLGKAVMRSNLSSAVAGGEGLFNLSLNGSGIFCIESDCPKEELIEITLQNDVLKVDGNYAIAWSKSLDFTVERSGKSLIGSAASGEGLVNVYRGTGKVLMMPTAKMPNI